MNTMPFKPDHTPASLVPLAAPKTLADIKAAVSANERISPKDRKRYLSALSRTSRLLGRPLSEIPAYVPDLRPLIKKVHYRQARISKKSLSNIKADLMAALIASGAVQPMKRAPCIDEQWTAFLAWATSDHQRWGLKRFALYCSGRRIPPAKVTEKVIEAFHTVIDEALLTGDPDTLRLDTIRNFNRIIRDNGLKLRELPVPKNETYITPNLEVYPASLRADIDDYLEKLRHPNVFDPDAVDRPLAEASLRNIHAQLRQFLDAAVSAGCSRRQFRCLRDLLKPRVIEKAFGEIAVRIGRKTPATLGNIMATLVAIAKHHVGLSDEEMQPFRAAKGYYFREMGNAQPKMSPKNERRLAQFDNPEAVRALVTLPDHLMREVAGMTLGVHGARLAMFATAVSILLACPLRIKNLTELDLERHIVRRQIGKQTLYSIHIPAGDVKNHAPIDAELDTYVSQVISHFRERYRPVLHDVPTTVLFPRRDGQFRDPKHVGEDMSKLIWSRTGLKVHPHLFRHLAAKLHLEAHPGDYETVRRFLGHKKMETTVGFYASMSTKAAFSSYAKVLDGYGRGMDVPARP